MKKVVAFILIMTFALALSACGGSSKNEPWKDLGTTKSEYMKVYNSYKYGY